MTGPHFLAVFGAEVARPPRGIQLIDEPLPRYPSKEMVEDHNAHCQRILESSFESNFKPSTRSLKLPGKGSGFTFEHSPFCSYATRDGVHVIITGEVSEWGHGLDAVSISHNAFLRNEPPPEADDAHWLLDFYSTFTEPDMEQEEGRLGEQLLPQALEWLASLKGTFAFVIFDSVRHRVLAARDREGSCPLYWGATDHGQLMFGSRMSDLGEANPTAVSFPAGCLFTSERHMLAVSPGERGWLIAGEDVPGELLSFVAADDAQHFRGVKAIPRITSKGMVCGAVYKVASTADMSRPIA